MKCSRDFIHYSNNWIKVRAKNISVNIQKNEHNRLCELNYHDQKIRRTPTHDTREHWTAVSTLLGLISSVYRNLHHWRSNKRLQIAVPNQHWFIPGFDTTKQSVCRWQYIRSPTGVEHSGEWIYDCHPHNAKLFERIEHSGIR